MQSAPLLRAEIFSPLTNQAVEGVPVEQWECGWYSCYPLVPRKDGGVLWGLFQSDGPERDLLLYPDSPSSQVLSDIFGIQARVPSMRHLHALKLQCLQSGVGAEMKT